MESATPPPQLELLPQATTPVVNPLVAAALRRIERAHRSAPLADSRSSRINTATAVAYVPAIEESDTHEDIAIPPTLTLECDPQCDTRLETIESESAQPKAEKSHNLVMVAASPVAETSNAAPVPIPKRLIRDDPNDPALNYLDSISRELRVDETAPQRAGIFRRLVCAIFDLGISALLCSPFVVAMKLTGNDFHDVRTLAFSSGVFAVMTFVYLTFSIALTGRTWAMRSLSLRVIDTRTGLIPTGGQSAGRAFLYLISLGTAGVGILYGLLSREGYTVHDRVTRTAVIAT